MASVRDQHTKLLSQNEIRSSSVELLSHLTELVDNFMLLSCPCRSTPPSRERFTAIRNGKGMGHYQLSR